MKKNMCFWAVLVLAIGMICQPIGVMASGLCFVCTDDGYLNVRTEPNNKAEIVGELADCQSFNVIRTEGKWSYGEHYNDQGGISAVGWIYTPYTRSSYEEAKNHAGKAVDRTVVVQSYANDGRMNIRREPTATNSGNEICIVNDGTVLQITRIVQRKGTNGWGLVSYNGYQGWINLKGVKDYIPTPETTPVSTMEPEVEPIPEPIPTHYMNGLRTDALEKEESLFDNQAMLFVLIAIALFFILAVVILFIVVLSRTKRMESENAPMQKPYYAPQPYDEPYADDSYAEETYIDNSTYDAEYTQSCPQEHYEEPYFEPQAYPEENAETFSYDAQAEEYGEFTEE